MTARWAAAVALLAGFWLRWSAMAAPALWVDEASTVLGARNSLVELIPYSLKDTFPPLHFMLLHLSMAAAGESEFAVRWISGAFGILLAAGLFVLGRILAGPRAGIFAAAAGALSPYLVYFSLEVRAYTQMGAFVVLAAACWSLVWAGPRRRTAALIGFGVFAALALYSQYLAAGPLALLLAGSAVAALRTGDRRTALLPAAVAAGLFAPWVLLAGIATLRPDPASPTDGLGNSPVSHVLMMLRAGSEDVGRLPLGETLRETALSLGSGERLPGDGAAAVATVLAAALVGVALWRGKLDWRVWLLLGAAVLPIVFALATSLPTNRPHWAKYFMASQPLLLAIVAVGAARVHGSAWVSGAAAAALALAWMPTVAAAAAQPASFRSDFRPALLQAERMAGAGGVFIANRTEAFADFWYYRRSDARWVDPKSLRSDADARRAVDGATAIWAIRSQPVDFDADGQIGRLLGRAAYLARSEEHAHTSFTLYVLPAPGAPSVSRVVAIGGSGGLAEAQMAVLGTRAAVALDVQWRSPPPSGSVVYLAVKSAEGHLVAQRDVPLDSASPGRFRAAALLPPGVLPGEYSVDLGLYPMGGGRLPADDGDVSRVGVLRVGSIPATVRDLDTLPSAWGGFVLRAMPRMPWDLDRDAGLERADSADASGVRISYTPASPATLGERMLATVTFAGFPDAGRPTLELFGEAESRLGQGILPTDPVATRFAWTFLGDRQVPWALPSWAVTEPKAPVPASARPGAAFTDLGDGISVAAEELRPGGCRTSACEATVVLRWRAGAVGRGHFASFVHVLDADGRIVAQRDSIPQGGAAPTAGWQRGADYLDTPWKLSAPSGRYRVVVGMYDPDSGVRLRAPNGQDAHDIGELRLGP